MVMELFPHDLIDLCECYDSMDKLIPTSKIEMIAHQICHGLAHLHHLGICHRLILFLV